MNDSDFSAMVSMDFFFDLAETCHLLFEQDSSVSSLERWMAALKSPPHQERVHDIFEQIPDPTSAMDFMNWLYEQLNYFFDEIRESLNRPEIAQLHFLRYTEKGAAWHNLQVDGARNRFLSEIKEHLGTRFPHWDIEQATDRLKTIPPYVLLQNEFTLVEKEICSRLSLDFVIAFLKSTYTVHLGSDPLPDEFGSTDVKPDFQLLRDKRPRYTTASHVEYFQKVKKQLPFSGVYANVLKDLRHIDRNENALEEALLSLTFKLSLPYAHDVIRSPEFIESMRNGDSLRGTFNYFRLMSWIVDYAKYLESFRNPREIRVLDIATWVPLSIELMSISLSGTFAEELYTSLDSIQPTSDEEFDG